MSIGVYSITSPSGKVYIGSSMDIKDRWRVYKRLDCDSQPILYRSLLKYGVENHKFKVLIQCEVDELYEWEYHYSNYYKSIGVNGLNCMIPGFGDIKGLVSEKTKQKLRSFNLGKKHTESTKQKMSIARKGRKQTEEHIKKRSLARIGKKQRNSKMLVDKTTGIFFDSISIAATSYNLNRNLLYYWVNGRYKNKTNLIYI